jgi:hypothetical protein
LLLTNIFGRLLRQQQAQMQLLSLTAKLDDLYELLRLDGINGTKYFERVGLRCRKQFGENGLSVLEESDDYGAFVDLRDIGVERQSYTVAVTTTTISSSTYDKPDSLVSEPDKSKESLKLGIESNAVSQEVTVKAGQQVKTLIEL